MRKLSARARWAVPAGVVTAVGVGIAASAVASAAEPSLPPTTPAQLIAAVQRAAAKPLGPLTATVQEIANLGLPALPQGGPLGGQQGPAAMTNPLAGTTTVSVWYRDPQHIRIAEPAPLGESDLRLDGTQLWLWSSKNQTATHVLLPASLGHAGPPAGPMPQARLRSPAAAAEQLLAAVGPATSVRVGPTATVAGQAAYQLVIAPKGHGSLVSQILIAVDARNHVPLRVQVFARGSSRPAFQLGFTSLTFGAPAGSNFTFSPPPGAKVKTVRLPQTPAGLSGGLAGLSPASLGTAALGLGAASPAGVTLPSQCNSAGVVCSVSVTPGGVSSSSAYGSALTVGPAGSSSGSTLLPGTEAPQPLTPAAARLLRARMIAQLPKEMSGAQRREAIRSIERTTLAGAQVPLSTGSPASAPMNAGSGPPKVLGSGWTSVLATPANPAVWMAVQQLLTGKTTAMLGGTGTQTQTPAGAGLAGPAPRIGPDLAVLHALLTATTPVSGSWGSGRLLRTTLLTVLITSKGQILAGAVTPSVLYADAATPSR